LRRGFEGIPAEAAISSNHEQWQQTSTSFRTLGAATQIFGAYFEVYRQACCDSNPIVNHDVNLITFEKPL
jgi:hypothetical protein